MRNVIMNGSEMLQKLSESLSSTASVKTVFGEPIHFEGKTVVPVAKVAYGFGGGFGSGMKEHGDGGRPKGEGGGGGGGVRAYPAGALEITATRTRFIPFFDARTLIAAVSLGIGIVGLITGRRK